jgi:hypothetical protein
MKPSDRAWMFLAGGVVAYELLALDNELMSEAVDRYLESRPILTRSVIITVALHLLNVLPKQIDPLAQLAELWKVMD